MARKPSEASHRAAEKMEDLNLSPIMALLVLLIPMLLLMFNFYEVTVQAVAAPKLGTGKSKPGEDPKKPLNLTVGISKNGFVIKQTEELPWEIDESCRKIDKKKFTYEVVHGDGTVDTHDNELTYDYPKLYNCLRAIPWATVARVIDASRVQLMEDSYDDFGKYMTAKPVMRTDEDTNGDGTVDEKDAEPVPMFDRVVFAVAN